MYAYGYPRLEGIAEEDKRAGVLLMYYGGDLAELCLAVSLFGLWYVKKGRPAYRFL